MEQEQVYRRLIQPAQAIQRSVDIRAKVIIAIKEYMILLGIVQEFCEHGFIGILTIEINLFEIPVCFAFLGEAIHLHVQVIQEKAFHAIFGKQFLHDQPVFLIQSLLIVIRHQHIVADQVRQTQLNAGGVDTLEDFLGIVIMIQLDIRANQIINSVMDHHNGICRIFRKKCSDQVFEQHIVMVNNAVLALIHLIQLTCHQQLKLIIVCLDWLEL